MTTEEAIKYIRYCMCEGRLAGNTKPIIDEKWQAGDMAIEALEKDTPKAPKKSDIPRYGMGYEYYDWCCPTCNKFLAFEGDTERQKIHHCKCGQRLDWSK